MAKKTKKGTETPRKDAINTPPTMVLMLGSTEEEVLAKACYAIYTFAEKEEENKSSLLGLGALSPLCQLIDHQDKMVRRNALMALGVMATNVVVKNALKKFDIIPSIIGKLSPEEETVVHEFATLCLVSLSVDFAGKVKICDSEGLLPLIRLLSGQDPDVAKNSLETVLNLLQDYPNREALCELGGVPPLLDLMGSEFPVIQQLALKTLERLTLDPSARSAFREEQGFKKLMDFLDNKGLSDLHVGALRVVSNCVADEKSLLGGLTRLMQFILPPAHSLPEVQTVVATCIGRVARSPENRKLLREHDVEKALVGLLSAEEDGTVPAVVQLLSHGSEELREAAVQALAVYEAAGVEVFVQMLRDGSSALVIHAVSILANMADQEPLRVRILTHGAAAALVRPLESVTTTTTDSILQVTRCLAALACDANAREEFRTAGGLPPLVRLLRSHNREVLRNACWATSVCANDEPTAVELCKLGALESLQEINKSENLRDQFSELAMLKLLSANLSVKYSLMGRLASTDITADGFYDAGPVRPGDNVMTLEELSKQPVNQRRPNLVTDAKTTILPLHDLREQYFALARLVSKAMGGAVEKKRLHEFHWELHLSEIKFRRRSNIIPVGAVCKGTYCHRAMLFKCLADHVGMSCTLVRGEYNRAWNEVLLHPEVIQPAGCPPPPPPPQTWSLYLVDLMHQPGKLVAANSPAAMQYQSI
ncbi:hypothetical protein NHX12_021576 [Muraenolepis orangiensis]|uniref:EDR1/CTR1/ARMC3-like peptidase-like domain-containing protein n=1 Tax=Muraenolepis orangiensis TaxID=630683 RepID=A0A9Q0IW72_9TELE|nr:hypothetical protein NHX12_021576 [Muraenolepis orangiensis]